MSGWKSIETAPRDRTCIQARIPGHGEDNIIAWHNICAFDGVYTWVFMGDREPPEDWDDGVCWTRNAANKPSTQPTHWKPLEGDANG